jgi:nitrogen PTS system EIIA component
MDLKNIFHEENCLLLKESSKTEALSEMIESLCSAGYVDNGEDLQREIFYREQLMSTGIGMGIAVPHVRYRGVTEPVAALGIAAKGIDDYESIDNDPVTLVVMIIVGENQHKLHIRLLSRIMERLKDSGRRESLIAAASGAEIFRLITGEGND